MHAHRVRNVLSRRTFCVIRMSKALNAMRLQRCRLGGIKTAVERNVFSCLLKLDSGRLGRGRAVSRFFSSGYWKMAVAPARVPRTESP